MENLILITILVLFILFCVAWRVVPPMILYQPTAYKQPLILEKGIKCIEYETSAGAQCSFRLDALEDATETWMLFCGNSQVALEWTKVLRHEALAFVRKKTTFVLFEYPGYGRCEGTPSGPAIQESAVALKEKVSPHVPVHILGFSLGGATALAFATECGAASAIIVSTFTSIRDIVRRFVGPLSLLPVPHNFDNRESLRKVRAAQNVGPIHLVHGDQDEVVPVTMGRELRDEFYDIVEYHEIPGAGHRDIFEKCVLNLRDLLLH